MGQEPYFPAPGTRSKAASKSDGGPYRAQAEVAREPLRESRLVAFSVEVEVAAPERPDKGLSPEEIRALAMTGAVHRPSSSSPWWNVGYVVLPVGPLVWFARSFLPAPVFYALAVICVIGGAVSFVSLLRRIW
jgi:hypothetical protein